MKPAPDAPPDAPKLGARRAIRRTVPEITDYVSNMVDKLTADHTVTIEVDGIATDLDGLATVAKEGSRVTVVAAHMQDKSKRREDPFIVREEPIASGTSEMAQFVREVRELNRQNVQTISDLHAIVRESNKGLMKAQKSIRKMMKSATKAYAKQHKFRRKLEAAEGATFWAKDLLKEASEHLGPEKTAEILGKVVDSGLDILGGKRSKGVDSGSAKAIPAEPEKSEDPRPNESE